VEASNVKITESASGKTTKFYLSGRDGEIGTGKMRFAPVKGAKKEVLLEIDPFGDARSTIKGSYTTAGKTVSFTLTKSKKHRTAQLPLPVPETPSEIPGNQSFRSASSNIIVRSTLPLESRIRISPERKQARV
jgi:hypothetical protein